MKQMKNNINLAAASEMATSRKVALSVGTTLTFLSENSILQIHSAGRTGTVGEVTV